MRSRKYSLVENLLKEAPKGSPKKPRGPRKRDRQRDRQRGRKGAGGKDPGKYAEELVVAACIEHYGGTSQKSWRLGDYLSVKDGKVTTAPGESYLSNNNLDIGDIKLELVHFPPAPEKYDGWELQNVWQPKSTIASTDVYVLWERESSAEREQILYRFHVKDETKTKQARLFNVPRTQNSRYWVEKNSDEIQALIDKYNDPDNELKFSKISQDAKKKAFVHSVDSYIKNRLSHDNNFLVKVDINSQKAQCIPIDGDQRGNFTNTAEWVGPSEIEVTTGYAKYKLVQRGLDWFVEDYIQTTKVDWRSWSPKKARKDDIKKYLIDKGFLKEMNFSAKNRRWLRMVSEYLDYIYEFGTDIINNFHIQSGWKAKYNPNEKLSLSDAFEFIGLKVPVPAGTEWSNYIERFTKDREIWSPQSRRNRDWEWQWPLSLSYCIEKGFIKNPENIKVGRRDRGSKFPWTPYSEIEMGDQAEIAIGTIEWTFDTTEKKTTKEWLEFFSQ